MIRVNMGKQDIQGHAGIHYNYAKHGQTGYTRVYSMTRVNIGKHDIQGYTV